MAKKDPAAQSPKTGIKSHFAWWTELFSWWAELFISNAPGLGFRATRFNKTQTIVPDGYGRLRPPIFEMSPANRGDVDGAL
jgi:hypothetical protein